MAKARGGALGGKCIALDVLTTVHCKSRRRRNVAGELQWLVERGNVAAASGRGETPKNYSREARKQPWQPFRVCIGLESLEFLTN